MNKSAKRWKDLTVEEKEKVWRAMPYRSLRRESERHLVEKSHLQTQIGLTVTVIALIITAISAIFTLITVDTPITENQTLIEGWGSWEFALLLIGITMGIGGRYIRKMVNNKKDLQNDFDESDKILTEKEKEIDSDEESFKKAILNHIK